MSGLLPQLLPEPAAFARLTPKQQRKCLQDALGTFLDTLQVDGRDPRDIEAQRFQSAIEALGEGFLDQAYEDALMLQRHASELADGVGIAGQPLNRDDLATGLRHLVERLKSNPLSS